MFRHVVAIEPEDIDHMGHVNNAVYLKWVQEAVVDYWKSVAPPSAVAQHLFVALRHEITYFRPTFLQDVVVAEVIAEKMEGARAFFRTIVRRGDEVLSEIQSCWCCLDAATKRPHRLARDIVG
ncbi:MAG TPA: thioesterase family protein, partial [Sphingomicrobium sp.]|nr:thioesterase family protein [Sphingomicrobium sp.]